MTRSRWRASRALAVAVCIATALLAGSAPAAADVAGGPGTAPFSFFDDWASALAEPDRAFLTGDWGGLRTRLLDLGIAPSLAFVTEVLGNPIGGRHRAVRESDELALSLTADLDRLAGWAGALFHPSCSMRSGTSLSDRDIGNVFNVAQVCCGHTCEAGSARASPDRALAEVMRAGPPAYAILSRSTRRRASRSNGSNPHSSPVEVASCSKDAR